MPSLGHILPFLCGRHEPKKVVERDMNDCGTCYPLREALMQDKRVQVVCNLCQDHVDLWHVLEIGKRE